MAAGSSREESARKRYRIEIGCGIKARELHERWQSFLDEYVSNVELIISALDALEEKSAVASKWY